MTLNTDIQWKVVTRSGTGSRVLLAQEYQTDSKPLLIIEKKDIKKMRKYRKEQDLSVEYDPDKFIPEIRPYLSDPVAFIPTKNELYKMKYSDGYGTLYYEGMLYEYGRNLNTYALGMLYDNVLYPTGFYGFSCYPYLESQNIRREFMWLDLG